MPHRWTWTKKETLRNTSHTVCFIPHLMDEEIIPGPAPGLDPECVGCVNMSDRMYMMIIIVKLVYVTLLNSGVAKCLTGKKMITTDMGNH